MPVVFGSLEFVYRPQCLSPLSLSPLFNARLRSASEPFVASFFVLALFFSFNARVLAGFFHVLFLVGFFRLSCFLVVERGAHILQEASRTDSCVISFPSPWFLVARTQAAEAGGVVDTRVLLTVEFRGREDGTEAGRNGVARPGLSIFLVGVGRRKTLDEAN